MRPRDWCWRHFASVRSPDGVRSQQKNTYISDMPRTTGASIEWWRWAPPRAIMYVKKQECIWNDWFAHILLSFWSLLKSACSYSSSPAHCSAFFLSWRESSRCQPWSLIETAWHCWRTGVQWSCRITFRNWVTSEQDISEELLQGTMREDRFYELCKKEGIPQPKYLKLMQEKRVPPACLFLGLF